MCPFQLDTDGFLSELYLFIIHWSYGRLYVYSTDSTGKVKCTGKIVPVHTMKVYRGNEGVTPLIRNLGYIGYISKK